MYLLELPGFRMLDLPEFDIRSEPCAVGMEGWGGRKERDHKSKIDCTLCETACTQKR